LICPQGTKCVVTASSLGHTGFAGKLQLSSSAPELGRCEAAAPEQPLSPACFKNTKI